MERPTVLILGKLPPPYIGPAVATRMLLDSPLKERYRLVHFDTRINDDVSEMGAFRVRKLGQIGRMYRAFWQMVERERPKVVLVPIGQTAAGFFKDAPFVWMAARRGARVLLHLRGSEWRIWFDGLGTAKKHFVESVVKKAHGAIVLGENLRGIFSGFFPVEHIYVVPNGGDYTFPERGRSRLAPVRVVYLANYLPGKGLYELLQALRLLGEREGLPACEFHAWGGWGSDAYRSLCMKLLHHLPQCHLHGVVSGPEKWQALADADVFVFTPKASEGHPWSIVEGLAAGLPVVSTDRGAISQSVVHGVNGLLLPHPEPALIADALATLIGDAALRQRMSDESLALYRERFTAAAMTRALHNALQHAMGQVHTPISTPEPCAE